MDTKSYIEILDELDDHEQTDSFLNKEKRKPKHPPRNPKKLPESDYQFLAKQDDSRQSFKYTYKAARFEEWWRFIKELPNQAPKAVYKILDAQFRKW